MRILIVLHSHQQLEQCETTLVSKQYLIVILICIPLITTEVEHLLMCLSAISIASLVKCLSEYFPNIIYTVLLLSCKNCFFFFISLWKYENSAD